MGKFALVTNGTIGSIEDIPANTLDEVYEKYRSKYLLYVDVTDITDVDAGWIYNPETKTVSKPPELTDEQKRDLLRPTKNKLLADSDWTQLPDVAISIEKVQEWRIYREELRNFLSTCDLNKPIWPTKPL